MALRERYDVIVVGGGPAGCAAAVSAARCGASTLLVERFAFLGGWATVALVNPFMPHCTADGRPLVGGIFDEVLAGLDGLGARIERSFDAEALKFVLQEMVLASGAEIRLHTCFESAAQTDRGVSVRLTSKSGPEEIGCERLIDCSGDGDAAVSLGAHCESGDEEGLCQAVTLVFDMAGIDLERALTYVRDHPDQMRFPKLAPDTDVAALAHGAVSVAGYYDLVRQARDRGDYTVPGDLIFYIARPHYGEVTFNTTHVGRIDAANADDLTRAEIESRRQMMSVADFVRSCVPGFESAYIVRSGAHVGVRETRRIIGEYVFSEDDVAAGRKSADAICRLAYPVDVHSGKGEGYTREEEGGKPVAPKPGDWYEIPYRCLVPVGVESLLVAGRCVSSTHRGHGAIRIMPCCFAMGQAAGTAAVLSLRDGVSPREVDIGALQLELRSQGAII